MKFIIFLLIALIQINSQGYSISISCPVGPCFINGLFCDNCMYFTGGPFNDYYCATDAL